MKPALYVPVVTLVLLGGLAAFNSQCIPGNQAAAQSPEPLDGTIVESGTIESADVLQIVSEVSGQSVIRELVPDGATVKKGDLLVQLDDSSLREELAVQQIRTERAAAELAVARKQLKAAEQQQKAAVAIAEQKVNVAELARKRKLDEGGELDHRLAGLERQSAVIERQLKAMEQTGPPTDLHELQAQLETARSEKRLLQEFVRPHESAVHQLEIQEARAELEQLRGDMQSAVADAAVAVAAQTQQVESARREIEQLEEQIARCHIVAPRDGVAVHANPPNRRTASPGIEEGATVRERQPLISMPDVTRLQARILVHESQIDRVKTGQSASLKLAAFPGRKIAARVAGVSRTPQAQSWLNPGVVHYAVTLEIPDPPAGLGIGMTVAAEIDTSSDDEG